MNIEKTIKNLKIVLDVISGINSVLISILASEIVMNVVDHEKEIACVGAVLALVHTGLVRFRDYLKTLKEEDYV